jgi:hypothetical protein
MVKHGGLVPYTLECYVSLLSAATFLIAKPVKRLLVRRGEQARAAVESKDLFSDGRVPAALPWLRGAG